VIRSFRHRGLKRLFEDADRSKVLSSHVDRVENILAVLNRAARPSDLDLPGFRLHPLRGKLAGFWAVSVTANWRVIFRFKEGDAVDVDLVDYH
jgi:proteic killer suppression protein